MGDSCLEAHDLSVYYVKKIRSGFKQAFLEQAYDEDTEWRASVRRPRALFSARYNGPPLKGRIDHMTGQS